MDDAQAAVRKALLENASYLDCARATETLSATLQGAKDLNNAGQGVFIDVATVSAAKQALVLGVETVSITFAIHQLTVSIPKQSIVFQRRKDVDELKANLQQRGVSLGRSLDALATRLCASSEKPV